MTIAQLQSFAAVARLASVKAAARELGVTEPSVSGAVAALRRELGDELYVREGGGIRLTPGGRRLAVAAGEILGLADQARRSVREAHGETAALRVGATSAVAELAAPWLLDAFSRRNAGVDVTLRVLAGAAIADALTHRVVDVALGPAPRDVEVSGLESVPFLRYAAIVVAAPGHPLAGRRDVAPAALAGERWLAGPTGADPLMATSAIAGGGGVATGRLVGCASHAEMRARAAAGHGIAVAIAHTVVAELERGELVALDVRGTPRHRLWFATMLAPDRRCAAAWALRRFVTTPEATQALVSRGARPPAERFRPSVHVTLWS